MKKRFYIETLGCKVNQYDSGQLRRKLISSGLEFSKDSPDVVILNTCAVTKSAIRKDRRKLVEFKKKFPNAKLVMMGCFPQTYKKEARKIEADLCWGTGITDELIRHILTHTNHHSSDDDNYTINSPGAGERSRYFIKIQDGCEQFCSYCNIPYARGKMKSRPEKEVLKEIKEAITAGYCEFVLCGIHLGLYGKEKKSKGGDLFSLLKQIVSIESLGRVRLSSIEVTDVNNKILKLMKSSKKICNHLHLPLQSGSDKILIKMNRPYDSKYFETKINLARKMIPDIAITTDVIVGFPGEDEKEFLKTKRLIEKNKFSRLHVFPFSAHENTPAFKMKPVIYDEVKKQRTRKLRKVGEKLMKEYRESLRGKTTMISVEKIEKSNIIGISEQYLKIHIPLNQIKKDKTQIGSLVEIML